MKFRGKLIGALFGLVIFGPIGTALGFIAGHLYDIGYFRAFLDAMKGNIHTQQKNYQQYYQYQQSQQKAQDTHSSLLDDAYRILNVASSATDSEVKTAYRRAMSQNHPDKLIAKGLPPEMIKAATQKTQQIKKAYEKIKKARGI